MTLNLRQKSPENLVSGSCIESRKDFDRTKFKDHTEQECTYCSFKSSTKRMQIVNISLHDMVLEIKSKHFYIDISCIAVLQCQPTYFKRRETIRRDTDWETNNNFIHVVSHIIGLEFIPLL